MKVKIVSPTYPPWHANSWEMHKLLGVKRLPDEGMSERLIQSVRVYVKPIVRVPGRKSSKHRVIAICNCGQHVPVGRLHQHKCEEPFCDACKQHKPCSCDQMAGAR